MSSDENSSSRAMEKEEMRELNENIRLDVFLRVPVSAQKRGFVCICEDDGIYERGCSNKFALQL